jgi:hypothetical protein
MLSLTVALIAGGNFASSAVFAQSADTAIPGHPRVDEVNQRLENQQERIENGVKDGQISAKQEARDEKHDAKIAGELSADQAKHNGHITKAEQKKLNKQLNHNGKKIHKQRHEVVKNPA